MDESKVSRPKLEVLDALRGFCALVVVLLHLTEPYHAQVVSHGRLVVEYFFMLTGFMFVYAYDARWDTMGVWSFLKRRMLRLYPLAVIGSFIGAMVYLYMPDVFQTAPRGLDWLHLIPVFLYCCTMLPAPVEWGLTHMLQAQLWAMQYIIFANIVYAFVLRRLGTKALMMLAAIGAVAVYIAGAYAGHLGWGYLFNVEQVSAGLARLAFPVFIGMVIARKKWCLRLGDASLWICLALFTVIVCLPPVGGKKSLSDGLFDASVTVFLIPLILLIGAGGTISNEKVAKVCRFLGAYSFPLYTTHFPFRLIQMVWRQEHMDLPASAHVAVGVAFAVIMFSNAYVAMKLADAFDGWVKRRTARKQHAIVAAT